MSIISIDIDRISISDLDLEPESAGQLGSMVGVELQRLLEKEGMPDSLTDREISTLDVPSAGLTRFENESFLAENLAQQIFNVLGGIG